MSIVQRLAVPRQFRRYKSYKRYLRRDFDYRCAYCSLHEGEFCAGGLKSFCVEHFRPRSKFPELECSYDNLNYACRHCNENKGEHWPSERLRALGFRFLDPCCDDYAREYANVGTEGQLLTESRASEYTVCHIRLNRPFLRRLRKSRRLAMEQMTVVEEQLKLLETKGQKHRALIQTVRDRLKELQERHLRPPIPYELADQK